MLVKRRRETQRRRTKRAKRNGYFLSAIRVSNEDAIYFLKMREKKKRAADEMAE